ncbi:DUF5642 family protein [Mycobacterium sp. 360MFTsu5.1]|uniref:DUF5642 family protein n=1 Tax=Mycobacterium sp. 360MFTsu5.1 TaxID=1172186 RepID=UPI0012DE779F|nr:DUF5642 family protein [Mycobacterium sp. 360MFTsu5.1]
MTGYRASAALLAPLILCSTMSCTNKSEPTSHPGGGKSASISGVHRVSHEFPSGWAVRTNPQAVVTQQDVDKNRHAAAGLTVRPPQCGARLQRLGDVVGQSIESITARSGGQTIGVSAAEYPQSYQAPDNADCSYATFSRPGDVNGTIVPAPALTIANMTVVGTHIVTDFDDHSGRVVDQYVYLGLVDDRHIVAVSATAGPAASDLPKIDVAFVQHIFQKAVEAVRA